ncbi:hypothetical protein AB833_32075 [Chromatiales bacterium (ex Bugula neritina AB1)]|nr:hypothetical protein AB833_32075 [Chromatiales bacterium (ex Bugula neritina AB1)]
MLVELAGTFTKIAFAHEVESFLLRGLPQRPAGRYNRQGQDALYLSKNEESARVALQKYRKPDDPPRVLVEFQIGSCTVVDLRHSDAINLFQASRGNWQDSLARGDTPISWEVADSIRDMGHAGLIDPSRKRPDLWHVTLFRWNEAGAPAVKMKGSPVDCSV